MLQLDSRGYIKGTDQLYKEKVVVLKRFGFKGRAVLPGDVIPEMVGDVLIDCKSRGLVRSFDPAKDEPKKVKKRRSKKIKKE